MSFAWGRSRGHVALAALLAVLALAAAAARPSGALAHALLRASTPAAGATLGSGPETVTLTFSEQPDLRLTSVRVLDRDGTEHVAGPVAILFPPAATVSVPLGELPDGVYTVTWRTVSSVDGHISAGTFTFGVGVAPPAPGEAPSEGVGQVGSPPAIAARWLLYLGLIGLLGAAWVAILVAPARRQSPDLLAMAALSWLLTAAGTLGVVGVQWIETGAPIEQLPGTSVGTAALARIVTLGAVGAALALLAANRRFGGRVGWSLAGLTAAASVVADVATGHAAAGEGWLPQVAIQSLHGIGAGAWVGGLAGLLVLMRGTPAGERLAAASVFSSWAAVALVVVAGTGVARAIVEIGTVDALGTTDFGRVVLVKSALLVGLAGLGAINRFVNIRSAARAVARGAQDVAERAAIGIRRLRRVVAVEVALAVAVLGASAYLVNLTPPANAGPPPPIAPTILATGNDFGTSIRARLIASPGTAGENEFDLAITDYDSAEPVAASAAELRFELASQSGVGPSTLDLVPANQAGRFSASGANLSIDGIYRITATITVPGGAVEIPLLAATTIPPQPVQILVDPGIPTIYTIQLGEPGFAQIYLDPGGSGPNELHVTFFDPTGGPLPVESATIAAVPGSGVAQLPTARILDVGHFVASVDVPAGDLNVDVLAPTPPGAAAGQIHLRVTIEVTP